MLQCRIRSSSPQEVTPSTVRPQPGDLDLPHHTVASDSPLHTLPNCSLLFSLRAWAAQRSLSRGLKPRASLSLGRKGFDGLAFDNSQNTSHRVTLKPFTSIRRAGDHHGIVGSVEADHLIASNGNAQSFQSKKPPDRFRKRACRDGPNPPYRTTSLRHLVLPRLSRTQVVSMTLPVV
ncbi:MAG: hypothetical protein K0R61_4845 [Microvirga sp.]|jgi:hypothetical protein|nr:hypothetical protein [Microvirga sp.]